MPNRRLHTSLKKFSNQKEQKITAIAGELGLALNGQKLVEVPDRKGFVFVRLRNNTSEVIQAYNSEVSTIYGLAVLVARSNNIYKVIGRDIERYRDWGNIPYLPKHGGQHSFLSAFGMGADVTWIGSQQMMPLLGYPSGSNGSNGIIVAPYTIQDVNGNFKYVGDTGTPNIAQYRPSTATGAIMVLVYIDTVSGNPYLLVGSGTMFHAGLTGSGDIAKYIPPVTNPNWIPDTAVRLTTGTTQLTWNNLYDVRPFLRVQPTGTGGGSGGGGAGSFGVVAWDEGVFLGTGVVINFRGTPITASISGTVIDVFVTGSGGTVNPPVTGSFVVQDEGITLGSATTLNVVSSVADISLVGSTARLFITGSSGGTVNPPITGSFVLQDDGTTLGSVLILNAGNNLTASISGSVGLLNANTVLLKTDDFTPQITSSNLDFTTTFLPEAGTGRLYYNGLRQRFNFHYTVSGTVVHTLFTPTTGSVMTFDYNENSATGTLSSVIGLQDEGILKGNVSTLNFVGTGVDVSVAGTVGQINITGSLGYSDLDPYGIFHRISGSNSDDDEFVTNTLSSYTQVNPAGTGTWNISNHTLNCIFNGQLSQDFASFLKPMTLANGEWFETNLRATGKLANYTFLGIVVTDGTLTTSKGISAHIAADSAGAIFGESYVGTLTAMGSVSSVSASLFGREALAGFRIRLKRVSSTSFQVSFGTLDGAVSHEFGLGPLNPNFTPTHAGLFVSVYGGSHASMASFDFIRHMS